MRVGIVGSSIGGCAAAGAVRRTYPKAGITVFERSKVRLNGMGTGLTVPHDLLEKLRLKRMIQHMPIQVPISSRIGFVSDEGDAREVWRQGLQLSTVNWKDLYKVLLDNISDTTVRYGATVTEVRELDDSAEITFDDSSKEQCDWVVGADGIGSTLRDSISPESVPNYSGYFAWRGICNLRTVPKCILEQLLSSIIYYLFSDGHMIVYRIPSESGFLANWVLYQQMPIEVLRLFVGEQMTLHGVDWKPKHVAELQEHMKNLPTVAQDLINSSDMRMLQVVKTHMPKRLATARCCLLGDAACLLPPPVGGGAVKAIQDALGLLEFSPSASLKENLDIWKSARLDANAKLSAMGSAIQKEFILEPPDWSRFTTKKFLGWFQELMQEKTRGWYTDIAASKKESKVPYKYRVSS